MEKYKVIHIMADGKEVEDMKGYEIPITDETKPYYTYLEQMFLAYWNETRAKDGMADRIKPP